MVVSSAKIFNTDVVPFNITDMIKVHVLNVNQGDCILVEFPAIKKKVLVLVIDMGKKDRGKELGIFVNQYLDNYVFKSSDVERETIILISHADFDHFSIIPDVFTTLNPKAVFISPLLVKKKAFTRLIELLQKNHIPISKLYKGMGFDLATENTIHVKVLAPSETSKLKKTNNQSVILEILYGESKLLFLGDAEYEELNENFTPKNTKKTIESSVQPDYDFIKVSHHGSANGTFNLNTGAPRPYKEKDFEEVFFKPDIAMVSVGSKGKGYGHPNYNTIQYLKHCTYLKDSYYRLFRTDDFNHLGKYNNLVELRKYLDTKSDLVSYVFCFSYEKKKNMIYRIFTKVDKTRQINEEFYDKEIEALPEHEPGD